MIRKITEEYIQGAVSFVREKGCLQPCRLAVDKRHWLPGPKCEPLWKLAFCGSGVRVRIETDAREVALEFSPLDTPNPKIPHSHAVDAVVDNQIVQVVQCGEGATEAVFDRIGEGLRTLEIWLPPTAIVSLNRLRATKATVLRPAPDPRLRCVTWGSSLTQCNYAGSAARVWPATVARSRNLHLTSLGFAGSCLLEPGVAMMIRDLPADLISLELGINIVGRISGRVYPALVAGALAIIREKHPRTPIALISPFSCPKREVSEGKLGYGLLEMRQDMKDVFDAFRQAGDKNLHYFDGRKLFGPGDIRKYASDGLHPNASGIDLKAKRIDRIVMPVLLRGLREKLSTR